MSSQLPNHLRAYRKRSGFTQKEIAHLLGCRASAKVSRYEHFKREPGFQTAVAYQIIFHANGQELFPGNYQKAKQEISKRAGLLIRTADATNIRKLEVLRAITKARL